MRIVPDAVDGLRLPTMIQEGYGLKGRPAGIGMRL